MRRVEKINGHVGEKIAYSIDELLKVHPGSRSRLYEAIKAGELIARKHGRSTIILKEDYVDFLRSLPRWDGSDT